MTIISGIKRVMMIFEAKPVSLPTLPQPQIKVENILFLRKQLHWFLTI
jgi:hypothetical protein